MGNAAEYALDGLGLLLFTVLAVLLSPILLPLAVIGWLFHRITGRHFVAHEDYDY